MKKINPVELFSKEIINYQVKTAYYGLTNYVNLDNAATTPPFKEVEKGVKNYLISYGSVHRGAGAKSKISTDIYEESRVVIKKFVNAPKNDYVLFTSNTTGALNSAAYFFSFLKGKVAVSSIEHSSSWLPWIKSEGIKKLNNEQVQEWELEKLNDKIQKLGGRQIIQYDIDDKFEFDLKGLEKLLKNNEIKVVVVTASSNVTGYCPDLKKIGELAHKYGAYFLVDACQYIQHNPLNMRAMGIDFLAASGHKFYAPYGGGFLIGPKKFFDKFLPHEIGGGNLPYITSTGEFLRYKNQLAHDPGTPNAVGAVAMAIALKKIEKIGLNNIKKYEHGLALKLFDYLNKNPKVKIFITRKNLNTVIPFTIENRNSNEFAEKLNYGYGIGVRAGSFCVYQVIRRLLNPLKLALMKKFLPF
jgi:cysteine desulfurase